MKLSEAILKGCEMTPKQAFHWIGFPGAATCAIGAALEGIGVKRLQSHRVYEAFPGLTRFVVSEIQARNDVSKWSRERIASWLAEKGL